MSAETDGDAARLPEQFVFRKDEPDGFGRYHDLIKETGASSTLVGDRFEATVTARTAPNLMLFDRQITGTEHRREPAHIRRDGFTHFYLQVLRSGLLMAGPSGDERWLAPGDAVLMDATRPQRTVAAGADYVTVVLARSTVEAIAPGARQLHGRRIPRSAPPGLGEAVLSLVRGAQDLNVEAWAAAGAMVAGLLAEVVGPADAWDDASREASDRLRAGLFIDASIGRPDLNVATVAAGVGMSRSALYRAFALVGGVECEIGRRRVARFRAALLHPGEKRSTERLADAFGFNSPSHCSRVFRATYGLTPTACRGALREMRKGGASLQLDHMRDWYGEIGLRGDGTSS